MIAAGVDAGTQSIKVILYDTDKKQIVASSSAPLELISRDGGVREQEASWWTDGLEKCFLSLPENLRKSISVIAVSGQQHGFVPLLADGTVPVPVKLWCDTSTAAECGEIEAAFGGREAFAEKLGNPMLPGYTASKIRYLWKNNPDVYSSIKYVLLPHDYLNWFLTGRAVMERGDASGTGFLDIFNLRWDENALEATAPALAEKLPELLLTPAIIGETTEAAAERLGIRKGIPVATGGGDNMMSAIGTGAVRDGAVTMSLGTSGTLFSSSSKPLYDKKHRLASFCSSHGGWLPLLCTMNCTVASEAIRKVFALDHASLDRFASDSNPGSGGVIMLPFLNGERVPDYPNGKGAYLGLDTSNMKESNIVRATLEGVMYGMRLGVDAFEECGARPQSITLTGGGANSPVWRQIASDIMGCPVRVPVEGEAAALGAALLGVSCISGISVADVVDEHVAYDDTLSAEPNLSLKSIYDEGYSKWLSYSDALSGLFR